MIFEALVAQPSIDSRAIHVRADRLVGLIVRTDFVNGGTSACPHGPTKKMKFKLIEEYSSFREEREIN